MDIQYFITFREAARCQSLTKAAEQLNYAQPTVSVQIKKLENHFGTKLFERNSNKLKLTDHGSRLLTYADKIVEGYMGAENLFIPDSSVDLRIGTTETLAAFLLPPYFQMFRKKYPKLNVTFFPTSDEENIRKLKNNEIDMAIVLNTPISAPDLRSLSIRNEELVFICPNNHPLSGRDDVSIHELNNSPFIFTEKGCTYREALERSMNEHGVSYETVSEMGSIEGIKQCVIFGMGIAMIPKIAVAEQLSKQSVSGFSIKHGAIQPFYSQILLSKNKHITAPINYLISLLSANGTL
ncbi:LysR family transcriptional regulator [Paenibacillus shunpengii]|uniref:LysR family transcriptional regulator n=1 Tax=Paenibacillus shunpengii TaxID=2054424 RepID=A0ABW5SNA0_9BACL|nr:LysR family transcriptional regulator [Paenibacillus sp. FSL H7-0326]OMC67177.1 LysR family transcriptional regulator [Paenibacillus sp. FSL H7-0326]